MIPYTKDVVSTVQSEQTCSICDVAAALARASILSDSAADVVTCTVSSTAAEHQYRNIKYKEKALCALRV